MLKLIFVTQFDRLNKKKKYKYNVKFVYIVRYVHKEKR